MSLFETNNIVTEIVGRSGMTKVHSRYNRKEVMALYQYVLRIGIIASSFVWLVGCFMNAEVASLNTNSATDPGLAQKTVTFDSTTLTITEGSAAVVNIILSEKLTSDTVVNLSAQGDSSAIQSLETSVTIVAGRLSAPLTISSIDDSSFLGSKTIDIYLNPTESTLNASPNKLSLTIVDDEYPTVSLTSASQSVDENVGAVIVTAQLSGASSNNLSIPFSLSGAAIDGPDFTAMPTSTIQIPAGSTQGILTLSINDDAINEATETIIVTLGAPTDAILGATTTHTVTVTDNDLGAFSISGITGASESVADGFLVAGLTPIVNWTSSAGATSYDVVIYDSGGSSVVCALQNTTSTSYDFATCTLAAGSTYKASVTAKNIATSAVASNNMYSFYVNRPPSAGNDGPVRIMKASSAITLQVITASDTSTRGTVSDSDPDAGDTISITAVTQGTSAGVVSYTSSTVTYAPPSASYTGVETFTYTLSDNHGATATGTVTIHVFDTYTWTGKTSSVWNLNGNWCGTISNNQCNGTTGFPNSTATTTMVARFDGTCLGSGHSCTASITAATSTYGLTLNNGFTGALTQTAGVGNILSVGAGGIIQAAGTFIGGNADINLSGALSLTAGTFSSTSANFAINTDALTGWSGTGTITIGSGVTFNHQNGNLYFTNTLNGTINLSIHSSISFWNLGLRYSRHDVSMNYAISTGTVISVLNDLTIGNTGTGGPVAVNGGAINVQGNIIATNNGSSGSTIIQFTTTGNQTYSCTSSTSLFPQISITKSTGSVTPAAGVTNCGFSNLILNQGQFTAPSGTLILDTTNVTGWGGTGTLTMAAGTTFNHNNGTVTLTNVATGTMNLNINSIHTFWNLGIRYSRGDMFITYVIPTATTFTVANDLTVGHTSTGGSVTMNGGTIDVLGNIYASDNGGSGSTVIQLATATNQTYSCTSSTSLFPQLKIMKSAGTVAPAGGVTSCAISNLNLAQGSFQAPSGTLTVDTSGITGYGGSGTWTMAAGTIFDHNNGTINFVNPLRGTITLNVDNAHSFWNLGLRFTRGDQWMFFTIPGGTTLNVANELKIGNMTTGGTVTVNGGAIAVQGNVEYTSNALAGTTALTLNGTGAQNYTVATGATTLTGGHTVNKSGGTLTLASNLTISSGSFMLQAGQMNMAGFNFTLPSLNLNGNILTKSSGVLTVGGTVIGTGASNGGTVNP